MKPFEYYDAASSHMSDYELQDTLYDVLSQLSAKDLYQLIGVHIEPGIDGVTPAAVRQRMLPVTLMSLKVFLRRWNTQVHNAEQQRKETEFFADARKELGYDKYLTEEGCKILEGEVAHHGDKDGYEGIYDALAEHAGLLEQLLPELNPEFTSEDL